MSDESPFRKAQARSVAATPATPPAQPAEPKPVVQRTPSHRWVSWTVWGVAGLIVVFVALSVSSKSGIPPATVVYEVRSDYVLSSVTYSTAGGISQEQSPEPILHD